MPGWTVSPFFALPGQKSHRPAMREAITRETRCRARALSIPSARLAKSMSLDLRRARFGALALLVLASCFHGPKPATTLAPNGPDGPAARTQGPFAVVYGAPKGRV